MGVSLKDVSKDALDELAIVLCLSSQDLQKANNHGDKVRPSSSWAASQKAQVAQLPTCFLRRPPCGVVDRLSQMTKRVVMAASGGAEHVARRGASRSKSLDDRLHPFATATLLCRAHGKMRPALMREIFYYLSREVADCADPIRRHPRHDDDDDRGHDSPDSDNSDNSDSDLDPEHSVCQSKKVRDWGHRMLGLSAMWCDSHTFRALELGFSSASARRSHKTRDGRRRYGIHSVDRMPRLEDPCEACFLAAIGSRSQALVDLRAGLLSRIAQAAKEKERRHRDKKGKRRARRTDPARPAHMPRLWKVIEAYVDAFDAPAADAIRHNSELLADDLFIVRACEARRRRRLERERKQSKRSARHGQGPRHGRPHHGRREPARMATKHGLRQPLPLLPDSLDPWATGQTTDATSQTGHGQPHRPRRRHRAHRAHEPEASRRHHDDDDGGHDREPSTYADPADGMYYAQDGTTGAEATRAADATALPVWEGDYRHAIFSGTSTDYARPGQSSYGAAYGGMSGALPGHARTSFVTVSMRTPTVTPTLRRRTSRIPVRNLSAAVPETVPEPAPEPVRTYDGATSSRLSRPASHIPIPRSAASSSSTRTASNGVRASPQSTARTATRAQSTARSTSPSTATPPNKPRQRSLRPAAPPPRPDNDRQPRPRTPTTSSSRAHARPTPTRQPSTTFLPRPAGGSPPVNVTSYIAAQARVAAEYPSRPPTAWPASSRALPCGPRYAASAAPPVSSSFYSGDNNLPWWEMQRASSVVPDDSISCVLGRRDTQEELAAVRRERQELLRQELRRQERQRQQQQRERALAQLTGTYGGGGGDGGDGNGRRSEQISLPSYLGCMAPAAASEPSMVPPPLQVRRLPPPLPRPPHQQPQTLRLSPWTRLQVQMHCRPLPPQPGRATRSTATTQWPDVRPYL